MISDELTERMIGAAIEVHRILGTGLLESIYEEALCHFLCDLCGNTARIGSQPGMQCGAWHCYTAAASA